MNVYGFTKMKRGQLQVQETILVVFIFVVIIILGMTLFFRFQENSLKNEIKDFRIMDFGNNLLTIPDSSEFVYTEAGIKKNAVDTTKLIALQNLVDKKRNYYFSKFGYMNITIVQIYPDKNPKECGISQVDNCGVWRVYERIPDNIDSRLRKETPVSLYFPKEEMYTIGVLMIEVYNI